MDAYQFGKSTDASGRFRFSVDRANTVKILRELANRIEVSDRNGAPPEPGDVLMQAVEVESKATLDDFAQTKLTLTFVEVQ